MMENKYFNSNKELKERSHIIEFDKEYDHSLNGVKRMFNENPDCTPIFIAIVGSASYGMDLEKSDLDVKGIYIQDLETIIGELRIGDSTPYNYKQQLGGKKKGDKEKKKEDIALYELGRYLDLVLTNNPNILELLNTPSDCIVYEHPIWSEIKTLLKSEKVLSKKCYFTFHNYAIQQIKKAKGDKKKFNNPISKERKNPIDFCYVIENGKSASLKDFLDRNGMKQLFCGMVNIPNARDTYALYYDWSAHRTFNTKNKFLKKLRKKVKGVLNQPLGIGYKGILKEGQTYTIYNKDGDTEEVVCYSNDIRLSSVPKGQKAVATVIYNKDGNAIYNKDYKEYWGKGGWISERNEERYNDNTKGGQNYDGKNMSHCLRLLFMAEEISEGKGIITMRNDEDRKLLISIKKGELPYDTIMDMANKIIYGYNPDLSESDIAQNVVKPSLEDRYKKSKLIDKVDLEYVKDIVVKIRNQFYNIEN